MNITEFAGLSVVLTGFEMERILPDFDTQHMAQEYLDVLNREVAGGTNPSNAIVVGIDFPKSLAKLTQTWNTIAANTAPAMQAQQVKAQIMQNKDAGVVRLAQNIIYMWYLAIWYDLAAAPESFSPRSFVVSPKAYRNSLVWGITGAHPMGYSEDNFGYWNTAPAPAETAVN